MNLKQIYYYVAVCECKSFSKAAEKVFVTQPALSKQIAALEAELGLQLIHRKRNGEFSLTSAGEAYLESFRRMVDEFERADYRARYGEPQSRRRFHMGFQDGWMLHGLIRSCNEKIGAAFPDVELKYGSYTPEEMRRLRELGQMDLCLLAQDAYWPAEGYSYEPLTKIPSMLFVSAQNPCVEDGDINIPALKNEPFYSIPLAALPRTNTDVPFIIMGSRHLVIRECPNLNSVRMAVLSGSGYCFTDAWSDVVYDSRFQAKRLPNRERSILLSRREDDASALCRAVVACIRDWAAAPNF